jgi:hypothetical protein
MPIFSCTLVIYKGCIGLLLSVFSDSSRPTIIAKTIIRPILVVFLRGLETGNVCYRPVRLAVKGFFTREGGPGLGPLCGNDTILRFPLSVSHVSIDDVSRLALFEPFALICDA